MWPNFRGPTARSPCVFSQKRLIILPREEKKELSIQVAVQVSKFIGMDYVETENVCFTHATIQGISAEHRKLKLLSISGLELGSSLVLITFEEVGGFYILWGSQAFLKELVFVS